MINLVVLMGRLVADPEYRTTTSGKTVVKMRVAVERDYTTGGTRVTDYIPCVAWDKTADFISRHFHKGNMIAVTGQLNSDTYEKDGKKATTYSVKVDKVSFTGESVKAPETAEYGAENAYTDTDTDTDPANDDDLPF